MATIPSYCLDEAAELQAARAANRAAYKARSEAMSAEAEARYEWTLAKINGVGENEAYQAYEAAQAAAQSAENAARSAWIRLQRAMEELKRCTTRDSLSWHMQPVPGEAELGEYLRKNR